MDEENEPFPQGVVTLRPVAPQKAPGTHGEHVDMPDVGAYDPNAQLATNDRPDTLQNVPEGHVVHTDRPVAGA